MTDEWSQTEIVTLAVYRLGGGERAIDTEDVAVEAQKIAPGRFSWRKYPEQINLELVRVYLSDAKKASKGELLTGSGKTGWRLSQKGLAWAQDAAESAKGSTLARDPTSSRAGSVDSQRVLREKSRIRATDAWSAWSSGRRDIGVADANVVFRIDSYAVGSLRETKITRLVSMFSNDAEVRDFLADMSTIVSEGD